MLTLIYADDRNNRLGLNDLKEMEPIGNTVQIQGDFTEESIQEFKVIKSIEDYNLTVSANGCMFRTDKESVRSP